MAYPNTDFVDGNVDPAFGGEPANRFGTPQHTFEDAQIRELQTQLRDSRWAGRAPLKLPINSNGVAGDAIVFDIGQQPAGGAPSYRTLVSGGYVDQDNTPLVGYLVEAVSAGNRASVFLGGGYLAPAISGLGGTDFGQITLDTITGRLRAKAIGESTVGYCDKNGNVHLLPLGFLSL